jgi:hypothetical protein
MSTAVPDCTLIYIFSGGLHNLFSLCRLVARDEKPTEMREKKISGELTTVRTHTHNMCVCACVMYAYIQIYTYMCRLGNLF